MNVGMYKGDVAPSCQYGCKVGLRLPPFVVNEHVTSINFHVHFFL